MWRNKHRVARTLSYVFLAIISVPVHAISFHFAPANINVQARAGQIVNRTFTLTLAKDAAPTRFRAHIEDWWRSENNNQTFYAAPGTLKHSCGLWCTINPVETSLKSGETMTIKLSIRVPDDAQPGGYWGALTVDEVPDPTAPKPSGVAMTFKASLSVGILVEIPDATRAAKISGVRIADGKVGVTLINEGNIPLRVNGTFQFFKPGEDQPTATAEIGGEPLLPEPINTCEFTAPLPEPNKLPAGKYKVRVIVDVGLDYLMGAEKDVEITRPDA